MLALVAGALAVLLLSACQSPALVRTARTLPAGANDITLVINLTHAAVTGAPVEGVPAVARSFTLPNPVPELHYAHGITDNVELGARVALGSGLFEVSAKYRLLTAMDRTLHLALAPALGYRVLALVNGPVLTLPVIVTVDLGPRVSVSGGSLISFASYSLPRSLDPGNIDLSGDTVYAGAGVGVEFRAGSGFHVMPTIEAQRSISREGDVEDLPRIDLLFLGIAFGFGS